ncbi:MAG TPA: T9SS type A sorting domain-containing protein [Bacteroidales bacterium]|nr:T9SS type A sorting domain-containing protein [Bacteroidales bacterium]
MKIKILYTALFVILFEIAFAGSYYVSTTGDNTLSGSISEPFKTISKAATMVAAGDTVYVEAGTYIEVNITPAASGKKGAMIVFKPLPGTGDVIIKHTGTSIDDDTPVFMLSNKSFIWIEGFIFEGFKYGKASIYMNNSEGNVVINNRFLNLGNGEVESWDGNQVVALFNSTRNVVTNNFFQNIYGDGVNVNSQKSTQNLVCNNTFIGFKGKLRSWGGSYLFSRAIDVQDMSNGNNLIAFNYGNDLYHHIWLDRDGSNNVVLRNFGDTGSGNVFNESRCAYNTIQENISINMKVGFMSAYYETTGWTIEPRWINNVAYNNETGFNIHKSKRDEFRNNIAYNNTDYNLKFSQEAFSNAPHVFSNNLWYSESKTKSIEFKGKPVTVSEFHSAIGDANGLSENPLFNSTSEGSEDFSLQLTSSAIQAGDNGLDLGAYAVYPKTPYGYDSVSQMTGCRLYFEDAIIVGDRGDEVELIVNLSKPSSDSITVDIVPVAGDALSEEDFLITGTDLVFNPGEVMKTVSVDLKGVSDYDETVAFRLSNAINASPGARSLSVLKIFKTPGLTAYAGTDQTIGDAGNDGVENVVLDASGSNDPRGTITSYVWSENGEEIATGVKPSVDLSLGVHNITLSVTNDNGQTETDEVVITIIEDSGFWFEAECGVVGDLWNVVTNENASNGTYVTVQSDNNSTNSAPGSDDGLLKYTFDVEVSGEYILYARVICPNANDDSFWIKMDNGSFEMWNNIAPSTEWTWDRFSSTYNLTKGKHTLTIGYREDGALLDKLWLTNFETEISGEGPVADNCSNVSVDDDILEMVSVYPNPVCDLLNINIPGGKETIIEVFNSSGQVVAHYVAYKEHFVIEMTGFTKGIYFLGISSQNQRIIKKIIKE